MARLKDAPITRLNKQRGLDKEVVMGVHVRFLGDLNEISVSNTRIVACSLILMIFQTIFFR